MRIWTVIGWVVFAWVLIWVINHPDQAALHVHQVWHAFFGSAGA